MRLAFPQAILEYVAHMPLYEGVFWHRDGACGVIVKLPATVPFSSMEATFETFQGDVASRLRVSLHLQNKNTRPATVECFLAPTGAPSLPLIRALLALDQIEVYAVTPVRAYIGIHLLPWSTKKRRRLRALVRDLLPQEEQAIPSSPHIQKEASDFASLHEQYQYVLHELHMGDEGALRAKKTTRYRRARDPNPFHAIGEYT